MKISTNTIKSRALGLLVNLCLSIVFTIVTISQGHAQGVDLTPAELAQLETLTEAERQAALQQGGGDIGEREQQIPEAVNLNNAPPASPTLSERAIEQDARALQREDRIESDQAVQVTREPLRQFGYELFGSSPTTFAPATNIPVPANYIMGPGDTVVIQLYGQRNLTHELVITREGLLMFPEIGPVSVAGLSYQELREQIQNIVSNQLIGQNASVTMGALRSINVFVLGEAVQPGSYTVSSLSTMTNALFASGGVTRVGSLRKVRLMRTGELVTELDLYDLLLRGDTSGDVRLLPGDVIFIPTIGKTVGIAGEVRRPAIYELKDETSPAEILELSGGLNPTAFPSASRIERINQTGQRTVVDVDLSPGNAPDPTLMDGDVIQVFSILDQVESVVILEGHVQRPGSFEWRQGMRVSDVMPSVSDMLPNPDLEYALIARETQPTRRIELLYVNLGQAIAAPGSALDLLLQPRDQVLTFGASESRQQQVAGLLNLLRAQASFENPPLIVNIAGNVRFPGAYPLVQGMSIDDVIRFAGGLEANTDLDYLLLERRIDRRGTVEVQSSRLNAETLLTDEPILMQEQDRVFVFNVNQARGELLSDTLQRLRNQTAFRRAPEVVNIAGNVRFPGAYPLHRNADLADLLLASGGLSEETDLGYVLLEREINELGEIDVLKVDLDPRTLRPFEPFPLQERDRLIVFSANAARGELLSSTLEKLRRQANTTKPTQLVEVLGNVRFPGTYPLHHDADVGDLLQASGGLSEETDLEYVLLEREINELGGIDVMKVDLDPRTLRPLAPFPLHERDRLLVFSANAPREELLSSTLGKLRRQANVSTPTRIVSVLGSVRFPGSYPLHRNLDVADLIQISGGLTESAETRMAEITRYDAEPAIGREIGHVAIDLKASSGGRALQLQPYDQLIIRQMPNWTDRENVTIGGEVNAPGTYAITKEDTLSSLIERAGGLTAYADPRAAIFLREELRLSEQNLLNEYRERLEREIITQRLQPMVAENGQQQADNSLLTELLASISQLNAAGRLVISVSDAINRGGAFDVILRAGDRLIVPRTQQEISVVGEVNRPTSHLWTPDKTVADYIDSSGGYTRLSDESNVYVIKASGEVVSFNDARWFFESRKRLEAGDSIVVPFKVTQPNLLLTLRNVSQLLFNVSTTLLAIDRVGN